MTEIILLLKIPNNKFLTIMFKNVQIKIVFCFKKIVKYLEVFKIKIILIIVLLKKFLRKIKIILRKFSKKLLDLLNIL